MDTSADPAGPHPGRRVLGRVRWGPRSRVATLHADGTWMVEPPDRLTADVLNDLCSEDTYAPWGGFYGPRQLEKAAELLEGTAEIEPREPGPPGRIH